MSAVPNGMAERLRDAAAEAGWRLRDVRFVGGGLEFVVFAATVPVLGEVALRVPRSRRFSNDNDPHIEAFRLLEQEAALLRHVRAGGLPVPAVHRLHRGDACDFLATELVESDGEPADLRELGRVAAALHGLDPPELRPVADPHGSIPATLAERVARRARAIERIAGIELRLPPEERLRAALEWPGAERRLLHMDLRPENVLACAGRVAGLVDWSNALLGDPALELARVAEYGRLDGDFAEGYGGLEPLRRAPGAVALLYRLDTAVMLAVVFLSESPDPRLAPAQVRRVAELAEEVNALL